MLFGIENLQKKDHGKYLIGYELGSEYVQISYMKAGGKDPKTASLVSEQEEYSLPFAVYKKEGSSLWYAGKEAIGASKEDDGFLVTDLLENAYHGKMIRVDKESYDPCAILALFIKRSFAGLSKTALLEQAAAIMFIVDVLDQRMVETLRKVEEFLQLSGVEIHFMGKEESFYYYNLHTDSSLWANRVYLYELKQGKLKSFCLYVNRQTKPMVTLVDEKEYEEFPIPLSQGDCEGERLPQTQEEKETWDRLFLKYIREDMEEKIVSAVYLIGDGFQGEWYQQSVRFLCTKRRVFLGNNLYSKGACYALEDKREPGELSLAYVYLGKDKLRANVGMELLRCGSPSYLAVLDGGTSWYDCKKEWDVILEEEDRLTFKIIPLNGKNIKQTAVVLHGSAGKKAPLCRLHIEAAMEDRETMKVKIRSRGFGEFFPSGGEYWEESIPLYEE